jgi:hypothetical protein
MVALVAVVAVLARLELAQAGDKKEPKYKIKEVMNLAHDKDEGLLKKIFSGDAQKEDKEKLVELYIALSLNTPKKGKADSWKDKTEALVASAKAVLANDEGSVKKLQKAVACKACHSVHK